MKMTIALNLILIGSIVGLQAREAAAKSKTSAAKTNTSTHNNEKKEKRAAFKKALKTWMQERKTIRLNEDAEIAAIKNSRKISSAEKETKIEQIIEKYREQRLATHQRIFSAPSTK